MDKKVLLKISNLKQYFPLKKHIGKEQLYVRANDDISLEIYQGETLGLVGESGCGKSTFGRTLLQLNNQTDGKTMYYGRDVYDIAPEYMHKTFSKLASLHKEAEDAKNKLEEFNKSLSLLSEEEKNKKENERVALVKDARFKEFDIAHLIGGLYVATDLNEVSTVYDKKYQTAVKIKELVEKIGEIKVEKHAEETKLVDKKQPIENSAKLKSYDDNIKKVNEQIENLRAQMDKHDENIEALKDKYRSKDGFSYYETLQDNGIDLAKLKYSEMRKLRRDLQLIFQDPYSSLNPRMTVGQIIGEGLTAHNFFKAGDSRMQDYVMQVMEDCGLASYMIHRYPHQFSGGQRQRIGIARSLAMKPQFVVCDEAVSALDVSIQSQVINLLQDLKEKENLTYLFISHDLSVVKYISDRIGVMYLGNMVELCSSERMFQNPLHPYTEALLLAIPTTDAEGRGEIKPLEGDIPSPIKPPSGCKFHTRCQYCTDICKTVIPEWREVEPEHFVACHHILDHKVL